MSVLNVKLTLLVSIDSSFFLFSVSLSAPLLSLRFSNKLHLILCSSIHQRNTFSIHLSQLYFYLSLCPSCFSISFSLPLYCFVLFSDTFRSSIISDTILLSGHSISGGAYFVISFEFLLFFSCHLFKNDFAISQKVSIGCECEAVY